MKDTTGLVLTTLALALALTGCGDDGTSPFTDSGTPPPGDSGMPGTDSGTPGIDSGMPGTDSGTPGTDSGMPGTDSGTPPGDVTITFSSDCGSFDACGGDPAGSWVYTEVCIEDPFADLTDMCPGSSVRDLHGTARGGLEAAGGTWARNVTARIEATLDVAGECALAGCATLESLLAMAVDSADCSPSAGGCSCAIVATDAIVDSGTYTVMGSRVTVEPGGDEYDFCSGSGMLAYREVDPDPRQAGVYHLRHR